MHIKLLVFIFSFVIFYSLFHPFPVQVILRKHRYQDYRRKVKWHEDM
jgi:hypothetical protein